MLLFRVKCHFLDFHYICFKKFPKNMYFLFFEKKLSKHFYTNTIIVQELIFNYF
jgi:hypothetical protein